MPDEKHIAVDMDDVMLDFGGGIRAAVETEYGVEVPEFVKWEMHEVLDPILGKSWWKWMKQRDWLWKNFPAIPGAIGGVTKLRDKGHYMELVTSKPEWAEASVWQWLGLWRPPFQRVTIVPVDFPKVEATEADVLIDDKPDSVLAFAEDGRLGILFARSHNRPIFDKDGRYREAGVVIASDWEHVLQLIEEEK